MQTNMCVGQIKIGEKLSSTTKRSWHKLGTLKDVIEIVVVPGYHLI